MAVKYLLKTTEEFRLFSLEDVKDFHKSLEQDAADQGYTLSSFTWTLKEVKEKGEVIDDYYVVKATKFFDDAKAPEQSPIDSITYTHYEIPSEFVEETTAAEEGDMPW